MRLRNDGKASFCLIAKRLAAARHLWKLRAERNRFFGAEIGAFRDERFFMNAQSDIDACNALLRAVGILEKRK